MVAASAVLWAGVPFGWLWVGSQVYAETGSIGVVLLVMAAGVAASIFALLRLLAWLDLEYGHARERRGLESYGNVALEGIMSISAGIAIVSFCIWFFLFSGSSPVPVNIGF
jgi:1,4-dihydroxy-2-naphthoate octaprenyltransferase